MLVLTFPKEKGVDCSYCMNNHYALLVKTQDHLMAKEKQSTANKQEEMCKATMLENMWGTNERTLKGQLSIEHSY